MIHTLLESGGSATEEKIAKSLLSHDQSQIEYYSSITRDMVGRVLRSHGIVEREGKTYRLAGYDKLTPEQVVQLKKGCEEKLTEYIERRGSLIWQHRRKSAGYVSGTSGMKYLKPQGFIASYAA